MDFHKNYKYLKVLHRANSILNGPREECSAAGKKNIIIVGGELRNKGAQAMTFTVVDEMRTRHPDKSVYLFSALDNRLPEEEKNNYLFQIRPWHFEIKSRLLDKIEDKQNFDFNEFKTILENAAIMIDISGYALSSQWGRGVSLDYILNIVIAKKFNVPFIALPQSMGPFDYKMIDRWIMNPLIRHALKYPVKIYIRERAGIKAVFQFASENVSYSPDIVFCKPRINQENIFRVPPPRYKIDLPVKAVVIVPNVQLKRKIGYEAAVVIFQNITRILLERGMSCYIVRHSSEDREFCQDIKAVFKADRKVGVIDADLNVFELNAILAQAYFVVASRYHCIVHAYKNNVPCLVLGWAEKYKELLTIFDQQAFLLDLDKCNERGIVTCCIDKIMQEHSGISEKISLKRDEITGTKVFENINEVISHGKLN